MDDEDIENLRRAKRTMQEIYDICQQHTGHRVDVSSSNVFVDISNKADYARSKVSRVLQNIE